MGGTFDPIHHGHLVAASEVASRFGLDEVVFVPTGQPWQKVDRRVSAAEDRYLMTVIATASNPRFTVSRIDVERPGMTSAPNGARTSSCSSSPARMRWHRSSRGVTSPSCSPWRTSWGSPVPGST